MLGNLFNGHAPTLKNISTETRPAEISAIACHGTFAILTDHVSFEVPLAFVSAKYCL
jgi:hypothetical protein